MKIEIPASVTYSKYNKQHKYRWKSSEKTSIHRTISKRLALRISTGQFGNKANNLEPKERRVEIKFYKNKKWILEIKRCKEGRVTLSTHTRDPKHIWLQVILNKLAPEEFIAPLEQKIKGTGAITIPVKVKLNLEEWEDVDLKPWDFLYHTEKHAMNLMKSALKNGFSINYVPKGREYDLQLINKNGIKFAIAILSHTAKTETRSKQHRIQKALIDIAKMLPSLYEDSEITPIILSQPFEFEGSKTFVGNDYLKFYKEQYGVKYILTEFEENWEEKVCRELEDNGKL